MYKFDMCNVNSALFQVIRKPQSYLVKFILFTQVIYASSIFAGQTLEVKKGQVYTLGTDVDFLQLDQLTLADKSTLVIPGSYPTFTLEAQEAYIGADVKIIGSAYSFDNKKLDGASNTNSFKNTSDSVIAEAIDCKQPLDGIVGKNGEDGISGVDVILRLGLKTFGSLSIDTSGGSGGDGQKGGDGQNADQSEHCPLTTGGAAGAGGNAGNGGQAGDIQLTYLHASNQSLLDLAEENTRLVQLGGSPGEVGKAGQPGKGSLGRYVNKKTLSGSRKWEAGGKAGTKALDGKEGRIGALAKQNIRLVIQTDLVSAQESSNTSHQKSLEQQLLDLQEAYQSLSKRVEALELAPK